MAVDWGRAHRDPDQHRGHRRRRAIAPPRATLPDAGLSDRRPLQASAVGRTRTQGRDIGGLLRLVRRRTQRGAVLRVLGHVEALPEGVAERAGQAVQVLDRFHIMSTSRRQLTKCARPRPASSPPRAGRRCSSTAAGSCSSVRRISPTGRRNGLRNWCVATCARFAPTCSRRTSIAVGLRVAVLGRTVPRPLVHSDDALAARTDEGCCPHGALAPRPDPELVPSPGAVLQWRCRRLQREGQR